MSSEPADGGKPEPDVRALGPRAAADTTLDGWLHAHAWVVALALVAVGLVLRIASALPSYLNPDEAWHVWSSDQPNPAAVYRANLAGPHPPLLHILLFLWRFIGDSDFVLRLPSVLAGATALWFAFRWLSRALGTAPGVIGTALLTFAPAVVYFSAEIREYSLLVCFVTGALWFLEDGLGDRSVPKMLLAGLMLVLALLVHYSAVMVIGVVGVYSLLRVVLSRPPRRVVVAWVVAFGVTAAVLLVLGLTQLSGIRGSQMETGVKEGFLRGYYYKAGRESVLAFIWTRTIGIFKYLFATRTLGYITAGLFLVGTALLAAGTRKAPLPGRDSNPESSVPNSDRRRDLALLLLLPLTVAAVAGVLGLYPYSATRHSAFLIPFLVAGISYPLGRLAGRRLWPVLLGVVLLMPVWYARYGQYGAGWFIGRNDVRRALMPEAMDYVRRVAAPGDVIFSDIETQYMLKRYLPGRCSAAAEHSPAGFTEYAMGGYQLVCPAFIWQFWPTGFGDQFHALAESYGLKYGDTICVPSAGWGRHLADRLAWELQVSYPLLRTFGTHISVFGVPVGSEVTSETLARRTAAAQEALDSLARAFGRTGGTGLTSLFWPGPHLTDAARRACRGFGVPVFTYAEAYRTALAGLCGFEDLMPALAFWVVGTRERHPSFMRYMDEAADYAAGGYRFTLIAVDPSGPVVAYLVEPDRAEP